MRKIRKVYYRILALVLLLLIFIVSNVLVGVWYTNLEKVTVKTDKLPEGKSIKLLQISDVHNKMVMNSNQQLSRLVERAQPDAVVITGDLIDYKTKNLDNVYGLVEQIMKICPQVYFITGNHEWRGGLAEELMKGLSQRGVILLDNKNQVFSVQDAQINLCGVADWTSGLLDLSQSLRGIDKELYTVMLAHDPWIINDYQDYIPDLTLSGHTHGGQIRLPFIGAIIAPGQKLFPELDKGFYDLAKEKRLYIDSGVGTSVFPIRFLNGSQITLITIE